MFVLDLIRRFMALPYKTVTLKTYVEINDLLTKCRVSFNINYEKINILQLEDILK